MRHRFLLALAGYLLSITSGCAQLNESPWAEIKGKRYAVELADTPELRERGLMFRRELAPDAGMLFIHEQQMPLAYWMKNTRIPLIATPNPGSPPGWRSGAPSRCARIGP